MGQRGRCLLLCACLVIAVAVAGQGGDDCPRIIGRAGWGARQPLAVHYLIVPVQYVIVQHTATPACSSVTACAARVAGLQAFFMDSLHYDDIGLSGSVPQVPGGRRRQRVRGRRLAPRGRAHPRLQLPRRRRLAHRRLPRGAAPAGAAGGAEEAAAVRGVPGRAAPRLQAAGAAPGVCHREPGHGAVPRAADLAAVGRAAVTLLPASVTCFNLNKPCMNTARPCLHTTTVDS
ncbi:peptidoglycan recognition protein 1-like isoform X1 [Bacillus rossius redtenbacheri]|uniref:peptidoglycan recognition protein 1-like isoform X1 n=1 Tax=Bacillus rossius redtenbacheri TaxID=93214 RepID=UPI002FDD3E72